MSVAAGGAMPPPSVTPNFKDPEDVLHTINLVTGILAMALMSPFVVIRMYIKTCITKSFVQEDWFCLIAWLLALGYCLTGIYMGRHGGGGHQYEVTEDEFVGFKQALYADTIVYGPTAWFTKSTLLLIYIRVFALYKKTHIFIYVFIAAMLCYYLPVMIIKIKICTPIAGLWNPSLNPTCIDQSILFHTDTVMSALTDLVVLILPIPLVRHLQVPLKSKLRVLGLLGAGGIATGASIVRLFLVFQPNSFDDETISFVRFNLLGVAEVGIGIICACLPSFGIFFARYSTEYASQRARYKRNTNHSRFKDRKDFQSSESSHGSNLIQLSYLELGSANNIVSQEDRGVRRALGDSPSFPTEAAYFPELRHQGSRDIDELRRGLGSSLGLDSEQ